MKIMRDGQEIELTAEELRLAHEEYSRACHIADIIDAFDDEGQKVPKEKIVIKIAELAEDYLFHDDNYGEAYDDCIQAAINDIWDAGAFQKSVRELHAQYGFDIIETGDFQCWESGGIPVKLCCCFAEGEAWLEPNENIGSDNDIGEGWERCFAYGFHSCSNVNERDNILRLLGDEAAEYIEDSEEEY